MEAIREDLSEIIEENQEEPTQITEKITETALKDKIWGLDELKVHMTSEEILPSDQFPQSIDIGANLQEMIRDDICIAYKAFDQGTRDLIESIKYHTSRHQLNTSAELRVLSYEAGYSNDTPWRSWPPIFEFLMPILNYNEIRQGKGRAMMLVSEDVMLLALRSKDSMVLTGKVEPCYAYQMRVPPCIMPQPEPKPYQLIGVPHSIASKKMLRFLEMCKYSDITIYGKKTFPFGRDDGSSTVLTKLDWEDLI
jgi:hypothetical protein